MGNYAYNVVYVRGTDRNVERYLSPHAFDGSADEFAQTTLRAWRARTSEHGFAVVNVWDADRGGVGVAGNIVARSNSDELDARSPDPEQIYARFAHYHVISTRCDMFVDDPVLGSRGTDYVYGSPHGLVVPGDHSLRIKVRYKYGWVALRVVLHESEPVAESTQWEAIEEAAIVPVGEVRVADDTGNVHQHYPNLTGGRDVTHLAIRVSARRQAAIEEHLIEAWPTSVPVPWRALKRDTVPG
jgi:hypothetical protein